MSIKLFKQSLATQIDIVADEFKSELVMEAFLIQNSAILKIGDDDRVEILKNQIHLYEARALTKGDGRLDLLVAIESEQNDEEKLLVIVELKKGYLNDDCLAQLEDYINAFNKDKSTLLENLGLTKYRDYKLQGLLVGQDIEKDLREKLSSGYTTHNDNIEIVGMALNKFIAKSTNESFVISEVYASKNSKFNRIRFNSLEEFIDNNGKLNFQTKELLEDIISYYGGFDDVYFNYTATDISINSKNSSERAKVFAYLKPQKNSIKIFYQYKGSYDDYKNKILMTPEKNPKRLNSYYMVLKDVQEFDDEVKNLLNTSRNYLINQF